jgi:DNA-binding CsgD family transcriptional regulator
VSLGFVNGPPPSRLALSHAALAVLRRAAAVRPLVVILDDLPWLDRASAGVLGFVARRLADSRICVLAALRSGDESFFNRAGLPELELGPLDDSASHALLRAEFPTLPPRACRGVLAEARGNPLALLELAGLSDPQTAPSQLSRVPQQPGSRIQALFGLRVTELPEPARRLLLLTALDGTGTLDVLRAMGDQSHSAVALAAAEESRLIYIEHSSKRLEFRHPLVRSAVVEASTDEERRRAHTALARLMADEPDRCAWHFAEAARGPDEAVAALLEKTAGRVLQRGDAIGAVTALAPAAELSPDNIDRGRRLAAAAYLGADVTGELRGAQGLLADARRADPELGTSLRAAVATAFLLLNEDGDVETAHRLLVAAVEQRFADGGAGDVALEDALHTLMLVSFFSGRPELWAPFHNMLARYGRNVPTALHLAGNTTSDPVRTAAAVLEPLDAAIARLADELDPTRIVRISIAGVFVDRLGACRHALWRVVHDAREGGAVTSGIQALLHLSFDDFWTGEWDEAQQLLEEAVGLCETHGYVVYAAPVRQMLALIAAGRGDDNMTRALTDQMLQWATPRRLRAVEWEVWQALALAALGRGDFEAAYQHATRINPAGVLPSHSPYVLWNAMDLVEAAARTRRQAEATAHAQAIRDARIAALSSRLALVAAGSAAIAEPSDRALAMFAEALAIKGADRWQYEFARVQLAYGERLRRARANTQSRSHLNAAVETFERLGAKPWAIRAINELRATGPAKPRVRYDDRDNLTPQEREIAKLAAVGLTNKQIGERLYLSHRTVEFHLHRIFPKLGISSRAALRDALESQRMDERAGRT